jgi:hypothetical protein
VKSPDERSVRPLRGAPVKDVGGAGKEGAAAGGLGLALAAALATSPAHADALSTPAMTAPLAANPNPLSLDGGPLGKVYVGGTVTGLGLAQSNRVSGDNSDLLDVSNGQILVQTTSGPVQIFLQAGAYALPALGAAYLKAGSATDHTFGALPVANLKLQPTPEISIQLGRLPTLIGAEYTFTFQNMNIERGLLWNQEPAISQGVQANYAKGPLTVSVSINDGFYSDRYSWFSGLVSYALTPNDTVAVNGGANMARSARSTAATPLVQNNGDIFNLSFTHTAGPLTVNPYFQYTHTDADVSLGIRTPVTTFSGAVLAKYSFTPTFSLAGRVEYISSNSGYCPAGQAEGCAPTNVLYGPGSSAYSVTLTPTYQDKAFFVRGEVSYVRADGLAPGYGFASTLDARDQVRGLVETGFIF